MLSSFNFKRTVSSVFLCVTVISCAGCSQKGETPVNNTSEVETVTTKSAVEIVPEQGQNIPDEILSFYQRYDTVINQNEMNFILSDIEEDSSGNSNFYRFSLRYETATPTSMPDISFNEQNGSVEKSFCVSLPDNCDNNILKSTIVCTIMATNPDIEYSQAEEYMKRIVNSYTGHSQSDVIEVGNYKFYISPGEGGLIPPELQAISIEEINVEIDTSEYKSYTSKEMQVPLNKGEKAHLSGIIKSNYEFDNYNTLEIISDNETYCIYYNPEKFAGCFSVGQKCDFYGNIAESQDGYAGCLRIDYFKNE